MSNGFRMLIAAVAIAVTCATASAFARRPAGEWVYYHFDGKAFTAGQPVEGTAFVAVSDGVTPVVLTAPAEIKAVKLAAGRGALVGICYLQTSGGKLRNATGYLACPETPVPILSAGRVVATATTDANGYFVVTLPVGKYTINVKQQIEISVGNGTTTLVPVRAGKRMVD